MFLDWVAGIRGIRILQAFGDGPLLLNAGVARDFKFLGWPSLLAGESRVLATDCRSQLAA